MRDPYLDIASKMEQLTKSQKKVAQYILDNPDAISFLTIEKIAKKVGVSDATIVRFTNTIGYKGYTDLQYYIQNRIKQKLKTTERLKNAESIGNSIEDQIKHYIEQDISNIKSILQEIDTYQFEAVIQAILEARHIFIISSRSADSLGKFLNYYLNMLLGNVTHVEVLETDGEKILNIGEDDVAIAISTARYTRTTVDLFRYAKERNAKTIALTDNFSSPLVQHANWTLYNKTDFSSFFDSFVSMMSMINLILAFTGKYKEQQSATRLEDLEEFWSKLNVFY